MRVFFLLLLLANLAFFAWAQFLRPSGPGNDPSPLARQIEPQQLRIVSDPEALARAPRAACLEWGPFAQADAAKAREAMAALPGGGAIGERRGDETAGWWVYMPPQGSRPNALRKAAELKALGIDDYFIVQDEGAQRWAISLGVFSSAEAADSHLEALRRRGVRSALVGARETRIQKTWLQARNVDAMAAARLRDLAQGLPGSEVRDCPAGEAAR